MKLLALKGLLMTEPDVKQTPQTESPSSLIVTVQKVALRRLERMQESLLANLQPRWLELDGAIKVAAPKITFHLVGHGELIAAVVPDTVTEADLAEFEQLEAEFAQILAGLDDSNASLNERQSAISELRQSTETALSELAEAVAAL